MTDAPASTSQWNAADYARVGGFVPALGQAALELLDRSRASIFSTLAAAMAR